MKNRGAITVFMVLITTAMLTLAGVIIDMSRILLAYYTISSVSESATRSMMANYDATLVGDYGLYAIEDTDENKSVFLKYVKRNLNAEENNPSAEKTFSFLKFSNASLVESKTGVVFKNKISDDKVFEKQIKEYQTPRAVIIATDEVISKFMDILTDAVTDKMLGKAEAAKDSVKKVSDKAKVVNEKTRKLKLVTGNPTLIAKVDLGKAWKNIKKSTVNSLVNKTVGEVFDITNRELFKRKTFSGVSGFDEAVADVENELKLLEDSLGNSENELSQIKTSADENQYNSYNGADVSQYVDQGTSYSEVSARINQIRQNITNAKNNIEDAKKEFEKYAADEQVVEIIYAAFQCYKDGEITKDDLTSVINSNKTYIYSPEINGNVDSFMSYLNEDKDSDAEKELSNASNTAFTGMNAQIKSVSDIDVGAIMEVKAPEVKKDNPESEKEEADFNQLGNGITGIQNALNNLTKDITKYEIYGNNSSNPVLNNMINLLKDMDPTKIVRETIQTANNIKSQGLGYQLVLTSYIMDKTNYLTSSTQRDHYFKFGETEYILNHYSLEPLNVIKSVQSVFSLRLAINFIYYFTCDSPPAAEGITYAVKAAYSAIRSVIRSVADMVQMLVLGQDINLIPTTAKWGEMMQVSYRDHLTVAVLLEADKQHRLINTINATIASKAEMEGKTTTLNNLYTTAETTTAVDCDLVFLNMFGFRNILGNVHDGKYRITKTTVFNY